MGISEKVTETVSISEELPGDTTVNSIQQAESLKTTLSKRRKWFILFIVALQGFLGPLTSSIYVPAIEQVRRSFHASKTSINATLSLYVFIMGVAPLFWASLSERQGRRIVYLLATSLYILSTIGCGLSHSIGLFISMRAIQAIGASAAQAVGAGTITDLFEVHERGPLIGPVIGPIAGGFINEYMRWRFIFWFLAVMGGITFLLILFFLPETSSLILKRRAVADKLKNVSSSTIETEVEEEEDVSQNNSFWKSMTRPFKFLLKPTVVIATTPYSMAYGFMYFVIASLPHQMSLHYRFTSYQIGLSFLANGMGNAVGAYISGKLSDRQINKHLQKDIQQEKTTLGSGLESRISPMWIGIVLLPLGELVYGWCMQFNVHFIATLSGLFILGLGVGVVQTPCNTYIVDIYQKHSASAMSVANFLRCISAGCTPLIAPTLIDIIGNGWSMTILAILSVLSGVCVFLVQRYGSSWRQNA
ncbi:major facilitator superfamily domain-containing protein [Blakeslea trispora]|nr:major facilitator superfamily domain-containing protein [Blakeslea trispora]